MLALYIVLGVIGVIVIPHVAICFYFFMLAFHRKKEAYSHKTLADNPLYDPYRDTLYKEMDNLSKLPHKEISITSFDNKKLVGEYFDNGSSKLIICFHGLNALPLMAFSIIGQEAIKRGYNVLIVHERAHHKSEGKFVSYGVHESKDVISWTNYMKETYNVDSITLCGVSLGAASVGLASPKLKVNSVILDSCYSSYEELFAHLLKNNKFIIHFILSAVNIFARILVGFKKKECLIYKALENNSNPTLFVMGKKDTVSPLEQMMKNYNHCKAKKDIIAVEATHTLAVMVDKEKVLNGIFKFIKENEVQQ